MDSSSAVTQGAGSRLSRFGRTSSISPFFPPHLRPAAGFVQPNTAQKIGFTLLMIFVLLAVSRFSDFFLSDLHLPLVVSSLAMVWVVLSGKLVEALTSRIGLMLTGLTAWLFLAIPTSVWRGGSFEFVTDGWIKAYVAFFLTACLIGTVDQTARLMQMTAYATLVVAALTIPYGVVVEDRLSLVQGQYVGANELARAMAIGLIYCWFIVQRPAHSIFHRTGAALVLAPLSLVMLRTGSRAALISVLAIIPFVFFFQSGRGKLLIIVITLLSGAIAATVLGDSVGRRLLTFTSFKTEALFDKQDLAQMEMATTSARQRLRLLMISIQLTVTHPIFGVGPGQFTVAENDIAQDEGYSRGAWRGTHNTYTEISSEAGIPALILFIGCLVYGMRELFAIRKRYRNFSDPRSKEIQVVAFGLQIVLLAHIVFYCFEHVAYSMAMPMLVGLIFAFSRAVRDEPAGPAAPQLAVPQKVSRLHPAAQQMFARQGPAKG